MNNLWILISVIVFIPVFSSAEEEKCDQATIAAGVELFGVANRRNQSLPEYEPYHRAREAFEKAHEAWIKARESLPEYVSYHHTKDVYWEAENAYMKARESLPEKAAYGEARIDPTADALEKAAKSLPEYASYRRATDAYVGTWDALEKAEESLPEYESYVEAREVHERARRLYSAVYDPVLENRAVSSFLTANPGCAEDIIKTYQERQRKLRKNRSYSSSSQSAGSSNSKKSQGSSSGKGVQ